MATIVELRPEIAQQQRQRELTSSIGMMVALGSWTMMFGALFFMYLALRSQTSSWPPPGQHLPILLPTINTVIIVSSSVTLVKALKDLRNGKHAASVIWMAVTLALGVGFVALQILLWRDMWVDGLTSSAGTLGTVIYGLTVLHALHVVAGVIVLGYLLAQALSSARGADRIHRRMLSLRLCGMFWHFVDAVWVIMFASMFLT
jgi:heme/copper-type cytochrome/quinol oxidase subunit 3